MVRRIMGEVKRRFDIPGDIPDKPDELRLAFANWLHMAAARGRVIMVLDALNQLEDREGAPDLVWLPPVIPDNVRLLLSTLPGRPLDDLKKRGWPALQVQPLTIAERTILVAQYLAQYTKALSGPLAERIAGSDEAANPLFLTALLEEVRLFGVHERLAQRIEHYLAAPTIPDLYERILARWEEDYERDRPGLVRGAMSYLWAARRGLSEAELLDLLGADGQPLPRAHWSPLHLAARQSLVSRSGLVGFFHDYVREAVARRYLRDGTDRHSAHLRLADYFKEQDAGPRKVDELPWQLAEAEAWQRLCDLLTDLGFFSAAWRADRVDIKAYWAQVEANSRLRMVAAYQGAIDPSKQYDAGSLWHLATLFADAGHLGEALSLRQGLVAYLREAGDAGNLSACLGGQAAILRSLGDVDAALELLKEQERLCRELGSKDGLCSCLGIQALVLRDRGDLDGAMAMHQEEERLCRELGSKDQLQASLGNQALISHLRGDLDGAMALHEEEGRICRELADRDGLSVSLQNQALILRDRGDPHGAMALLEEREHLCRDLGDRDGLQVVLGNQALILRELGRLGEAMALHREEERLCRELGSRDGLAGCLGNKALVLRDLGDLEGAMAHLKEQERIYRALGKKEGLQRSLGHQAAIFVDRGDLDGAMVLFKEQERLCRELGTPEGLAIALVNEASVMAIQAGREREALSLAEQAYRIASEHGLSLVVHQMMPVIDSIRSRLP
jgi:tetratricopeptide (TPR) repeat protein